MFYHLFLSQLMSGVTAKGDKALEELKEKYDDVVAQRTQQATTIAQKTEELARVTQQCEQHKISLHQKTGELSRVTSLRDNMSVALKQKTDELTRVTQREQLTADLLLQRTQELSRVTQQLTSLRGKTAQLIGMLNEVSKNPSKKHREHCIYHWKMAIGSLNLLSALGSKKLPIFILVEFS